MSRKIWGMVFVAVFVFSGVMAGDQSRRLVVPLESFRPCNGELEAVMQLVYDNPTPYVMRGNSLGWLLAPVNLPAGAVVEGIQVRFMDNDAEEGRGFFCEFVRYSPFSPSPQREVMFRMDTADYPTSSDLQWAYDWSLDGGSRRIRDTYNYAIQVSFWDFAYWEGEFLRHDDLRLYGVVIQYHLE